MARTVILIAVSLSLAAGSGFLASQAVGVGSQGPARTVTINVGTGQTGPQGPAGPAGPPGPQGATGPSGSIACPQGYEPGLVVIEHESQETRIWTCLQP